VNVDADVIHVEHGWDVKAGEIEPKSKAGIREIPVPEILKATLVAHLEQTRRSEGDFIFGRTSSAPFTDSHMRKRARTAWAAAAIGSFLRGESGDLEPIGFHEARHSYSTYLDAAGISETRADRYMGHANPSVARRYRHQLEGQLAEDAKRLDEYPTGTTAGKVVPLPTGAHAGTQAVETRTAAGGA
jgi:integrase